MIRRHAVEDLACAVATTLWALRVERELVDDEGIVAFVCHAVATLPAHHGRPVGVAEPARRSPHLRVDGVNEQLVACIKTGQIDLLIATVATPVEPQQRSDSGDVVVAEARPWGEVVAVFVERFLNLDGAIADGGQLTVNIGITGVPDVDGATTAAYELAGISLPQHDPVTPPLSTHIISASDPDDEVRAVIQAITGWRRTYG